MVNGNKSVNEESLVFFYPPAGENTTETNPSVEVMLPVEDTGSSVEIVASNSVEVYVSNFSLNQSAFHVTTHNILSSQLSHIRCLQHCLFLTYIFYYLNKKLNCLIFNTERKYSQQ